jgi:hypothetical protein
MKTANIRVLVLLAVCLATIGLRAQTAKSQPCNKNGGVRFNLEPRADAVFQIGPQLDFILNGVGPGDDLIVQTANDWRGAFPSSTWDNSIGGYYVHSSKTADCSVQFEGGLPNINGTEGQGQSVVTADSVRGAFFVATDTCGNACGGFILYRASAADLLNPQICPPGTHLQAQAVSCWEQTPPAYLDQNSFNSTIELGIGVDQRTTGTGAGDVYVAYSDTNLYLTTCTNASLNCSPPLTLYSYSETNTNTNQFSSVQVRPDGVITIAYAGGGFPGPSPTPASVFFVTCTPAGAPNPPVCGPAVTVATLAEPIAPQLNLGNISLAYEGDPLYPKIVNRLESNGQFTTFLIYDECENPYLTQPAPIFQLNRNCLNSVVEMTFSEDGGQTWSTPSPISPPSPALNFFSSITNDSSTGTVSIAYYSTQGDVFFRNARVLVSQIAPGSTTVGPAKAATAFTPIDTDPGQNAESSEDWMMGVTAHGTGTPGESHLYLSFDSELVDGTYDGAPLPELNNFLELIPY